MAYDEYIVSHIMPPLIPDAMPLLIPFFFEISKCFEYLQNAR